MLDIINRLKEREAERLKNELEAKGEFLKLRELRGYSPKELAKRLKRSAEVVAEMAGRVGFAAEDEE